MTAEQDPDGGALARITTWPKSLSRQLVATAQSWLERVPDPLKRHWMVRTTFETIRLVRANRALGVAAEVSFWAVLSITPLLLVSASALGWLDGLFGLSSANAARTEMTRFVRQFLGINQQAVDAIDELFDNPDPARFTFGVLTSIYASSRGFISLIGALDHILARDKRRNWFTTRIAGFGASVVSIPLLVALLIVINVGLGGFGLEEPWRTAISWGVWIAITGGLLGFALWLLHAAPAQKTPLLHDFPGAAFTVAVWFGGSWVISQSLDALGGNDVLGLLGSSIGLLIWLYLMTSGVLVGAQVNVAINLVAADPGSSSEATEASTD